MNRQDGTHPRIEALRNGPLKLSGLEKVTDTNGSDLHTGEPVLLCRCGQSARKPFCDGTHARVGYHSHKLDGRVADRMHDFPGREITIHDNRGVCSHAEHCVRDLPSVFDRETRPWIHPDGAPADAIARTIEKCPSGALSYTRDGVLHKDLSREPAIRVDRCGPYEVTGGLELVDPEGSEPESKEHYTLCRCGASKNKPFCDGEHWNVPNRDQRMEDCHPFHAVEESGRRRGCKGDDSQGTSH